MIIISQYLLKLKQKTKKKNFNLNNTNILLNWFITFPEGVYGGEKSWKFGFRGGRYSGTSDLDLGKKVGNLEFWDGGVFWNFGFGLRKKSW